VPLAPPLLVPHQVQPPVPLPAVPRMAQWLKLKCKIDVRVVT